MNGRAVGVIGGMGPAATVQFLARLQALTPAARDQDHLRLIVDCNPAVPDRNEAVIGGGRSPGPVLAEMARGLERAGAELLVMPCNTAHAFVDAITAASSLPFINLIDTACTAVTDIGGAAVGLLAADGCLEAGLYQRAFGAQGVDVIVCPPERQAVFMDLLYRIKAGDRAPAIRRRMRDLANDLVKRGADALLAGCTEVPLALGPDDVEAPLVDSLEALARRTVAEARAARNATAA